MTKVVYGLVIGLIITVGVYAALQKSNPKQILSIANIQDLVSLENRFELSKKERGTKLYYSEKLGVGFTYKQFMKSRNDSITESDNKIQFGDWHAIEVFEKSASTTLTEAVTKDFIGDSLSGICFFQSSQYPLGELSTTRYATGFILYLSDIPSNTSNFLRLDTCSRQYSTGNGVRFFLEDKTVPTKYIFVEGGQDSCFSDGSPEVDGSWRTWMDSLQMLK